TDVDLDGVAEREGRTVMKWTAVAMWGLLSVCTGIGETAARGRYSNFGSWPSHQVEDRYNPQYIDRLPPEIRDSILRKCNDPKALHQFAGYFDDSKRIVLHFEHFVCDGDGTYCNPSGCLHQVWALVRGHYLPCPKLLCARWR